MIEPPGAGIPQRLSDIPIPSQRMEAEMANPVVHWEMWFEDPDGRVIGLLKQLASGAGE